MDKRLLTALFLCFLLLWLHTILFPPPERPDPPPQSAEEAHDASEDGLDDSDDGMETIEDEGAEEQPESIDPDTPVTESVYEASSVEAEEEIVVETDIFMAVFANRGAALRSLRFKNYFTDSEVQKDPAAMANPENWLEILGSTSESQFSFMLEDAGGSRDGSAYDFANALWESSVVETSGGGARVTFSFRPGDGLKLSKVFTFHGGAQHMGVQIAVENENPNRKGGLNLNLDGMAGIDDQKRASFTLGPTGVFYTGDPRDEASPPELLDFPAADLKGDPYSFAIRKQEEHLFSGVMSNYFALLLRPGEGKLLRKIEFRILEDDHKYAQFVETYRQETKSEPSESKLADFREQAKTNVLARYLLKVPRIPDPGQVVAQDLVFYAGPKSTDLLQSEPYTDFYPLIEESYGSFAWINKSLIWILRQFYAIFSNWGVAIVCLTFVVKGLLFPLNRYQQVSMHKYQQKMAVMKPKLDELKKKHKNNKKKFNEAQMKLMKEHGATPPLMGCLVIFFQLPIFFGLFQILRTSFELRHSPFILWIKDLSQPDALFSLPFTIPLVGSDTFNLVPILMTVAFFYQQKAMPKPADPQAQQTQKIMKFMPFLFLFFFYGYASGLSLYWMTSNLISIAEYKFIRKKFPVGGNAEPKPESKNSPKKTGKRG